MCLRVLILAVLHLVVSQSALASAEMHGKTPAELGATASIQSLKDTGDYESLFSVFEQARHAIRPVELGTGYWSQTPAHGLHSRFDSHGLLLSVETARSKHYTTRMRLISVGYGGGQHSLKAGMTKADGNRVTIDRGLLQEWFVNRPGGLEQGFTILRKPLLIDSLQYEDGLRLVMQTEGTLRPVASGAGQSVEFYNDADEQILEYTGLLAWDASGEVLEARMKTKGSQIVFHIDDEAARYPLTIDPTYTQQAYLKASNAESDDGFGSSISLFGDTVVVGAVHEDSGSTGVDGGENDNSSNKSGAAYVFVRDANGVWSQQAYLKASNTGAFDHFGASVSVSGDALVVGANLEDGGSTGVNGDDSNDGSFNSGAAYIFTRDGGGSWSQQAYLKASNASPDDEFGNSVAVSGNTVVVSALGESSDSTGVNGDESNFGASVSGAAYVFVRNAIGVWSQQAYLKASNTTAFDVFGSSVSVSGNTVVVGADAEDSSSTGVNGDEDNDVAQNSGAAYVYLRDAAGTWSQQAYLKASNTDSQDRFGGAVSVSGDTVVVGAHQEDSGATGVNGDGNSNIADGAGAAYVFIRDNSGSWNQQAYLKASNTGAGDWFGRSVSVSEDIIVVGAFTEDSDSTGVNGDELNNNASNAGAAYMYVRTGSGGWSQQAYLKASNTDVFQTFGRSVSVSGDTVLSGAPTEDNGSGAVYVYTPMVTNHYCNGLLVDVNLEDGDLPTSDDDVIRGTSGSDLIVAMGGDDTICGLGGDDDINGGRGDDWIDAGEGDDTVQGANDNDEIYGGDGEDTLFGGPGDDIIHGEEGDDFIKGNSDDDTLYGNEGIDKILGGSGNDEIYTGSGSNVGTTQSVTGGNGDDLIYGGPDADLLRGEAGADTIMGAAGDDMLYGGGGEDMINGQGGNDLVRGNGAADVLYGGAGDDQVDGLGGNDILYGGSGADNLSGSTGNDTMYGNSGDDYLNGGGGNDELNGGLDTDDCDGAGGTGDSATGCELETNVP